MYNKPASAVKPMQNNLTSDTDSKQKEYWDDRLDQRRKPRGARFMTISSTRPLELEQTPSKKGVPQTAAGDLIAGVNNAFSTPMDLKEFDRSPLLLCLFLMNFLFGGVKIYRYEITVE